MIHRAIETPQAGTVHHIELTCADFDEEFSLRYSNKCSEGCAEGMKMFFTPSLRGSTIHANVCSGRWEFVNKLSREWWVRKAAPILGWNEQQIREQTDPKWAANVRGVNNSSVRSSAARGPRCLMCDAPIKKGYDVCFDCDAKANEKPKGDSGSLDEIDNWD